MVPPPQILEPQPPKRLSFSQEMFQRYQSMKKQGQRRKSEVVVEITRGADEPMFQVKNTAWRA